MQEIQSPVKLVTDVLGKPNTDGPLFRLTKHCLRADCEDGVLLFHTLTGELVHLEKGELDSPGAAPALIGKHFLIEAGEDENRQADAVRRIVGALRSRNRKVTGFTVLTTTDCNARCFYCYEKGVRRVSMTRETAERTAAHIIGASGGEKVRIGWFGGEPLVNGEVISLISQRLTEAGVPFSAHMTSNGLLFDAESVRKAVSLWRLEHIQITLDGTESAYNRIKAYADAPENPFEQVNRNISLLLEAGVRVIVRLNMNRHNSADLQQLAEELGRRYGRRKGFYAQPVLLRSFAGDVGGFLSDADEVAAYSSLKQRLSDLGIGRNEPLSGGYGSVRCMADNDGCEVIHPDGKVAKCEHYDENEVIGDIFTDARDEVVRNSWKEEIRFDRCADCPMYPRCINLKKCPWAAFGCSEAQQELRIGNYLERMKNTYRRHLNASSSDAKAPINYDDMEISHEAPL